MKRILLVFALAIAALAAMGGVAVASHDDDNPFFDDFDVGADDDGTAQPGEGAFVVVDDEGQPAASGRNIIFLVGHDCEAGLTFAAAFVGDQANENADPDSIGAGAARDECTGDYEVTLGVVRSHPGYENYDMTEDLVVEGTGAALDGNRLLDLGGNTDEDTAYATGDSENLGPLEPPPPMSPGG